MEILKKYKLELFAAFIFGMGLDIAQMTDSQKVIGFLDITGDWDPTLIFVMIGGIAVHSMTYLFYKNKNANVRSVLDGQKRQLDRPLILGSFLFGLGWGITGFCPGPGLASLMRFEPEPYVMVAAMLVGMVGFKLKKDSKKKSSVLQASWSGSKI